MNSSQNDIKTTAPALLDEMCDIRSRSIAEIARSNIAEPAISNAEKDNYVSLADRLSSFIKDFVDDELIKKRDILLDRLNKNKDLMHYDPLQDSFWKKKENAFLQSLDDLLIAIAKDDFYSFDAKHHVFQAIKILGAAEKEPNEKLGVYDTVLPFSTQPVLPKSSIPGTVLGSLLGEVYRVESDNLTLKVKGNLECLDSVLEKAKECGFANVRFVMRRKEYESLIEIHQYKENLPAIVQGLNKQANQSFENPSEASVKKTLSNIIKYTGLVSSLVLGTLPSALKKKVSEYFKDYSITKKIEKGSKISELLEASTGILTTGLSVMYPPLVFVGVPLILASAIRIRSSDKYESSLGPIALELMFAPFAGYLNRNKDNPLVEVEFKIQDLSRIAGSRRSELSYFRQIAESRVPEEFEKNLEWRTDNHNSYGKEFVDYIKKNTEFAEIEKKIPLNIAIDRERQQVRFTSVLHADSHTKYSALVCTSGKRYLATIIIEEDIRKKEKTDVISLISIALLQDADEYDKIDAILGGLKQENLKLKYARLICCKNGEIVSNVEEPYKNVRRD